MASISSSSSSTSTSFASSSTASRGVAYSIPTARVFVELNPYDKTEYTPKSSMDDLIKCLRTARKPLIAMATFASAYKTEPKAAPMIYGSQRVYTWPPGAEQIEGAKKNYSLILSAKQHEGEDRIFFMECRFIKLEETRILTTELQPEGRIYMITHKTFNAHLSSLYPQKTAKSALEKKLSFLAVS